MTEKPPRKLQKFLDLSVFVSRLEKSEKKSQKMWRKMCLNLAHSADLLPTRLVA